MEAAKEKEFEELLLKEKKELEEMLATVASKNPRDPSDWEASYPDLNVDPSDKSDMADEVEEFDTNIGINTVLETRLKEVVAALERIQSGKYGMCDTGGEPIEEKRLKANPAARTCLKHAA